MANYIGLDVCASKQTADQLAAQYRLDAPPRKNVKIIETKRLNVYKCDSDINSCQLKYDTGAFGSIVYVVYSEM